ATVDPTKFAQPLHKSRDPLALDRRRARAQEPDGRQLYAQLRAGRERPRRRAADERDELAAFHLRDHSITSSARASSVGGTSRPSIRAVFRLITSSNFVGCWTGKSPGFAPRRTRST